MQFYEAPVIQIKPNLNDEVEKWLADKSNKITELEFGFSNFPDGKIPMCKRPVQQLDIEKYNAEKVTKHSPISPENAPRKAKPTKVKTVKKRKPKPKAEKVLKPKKATKLVVYTESSMIYMHNCKAFKNARDNDLEEFEALCIRHAFSTFKKQKSGRYRCVSCLDDYNGKNIKDYKRRKLNRELMLVAFQAKQTSFLGVCKIHGETKFLISPSNNTLSQLNYKCRTCSREAQIKSKKKGAAA